ncbi:hypothetical protein TBC1_11135 [Lentimicrobium saccharophilum]|uniref:Cellobiose phosphorylase n=2 Tax=Lentimicrobium saccharophilum TaxID=1678841 RepID=A0A0S7BU37_9BACT|nr:hypothetical protein TBC1_11135 [Lentimicrobium saccharophilum]
MNFTGKSIEMQVVEHENESYFKISDHDLMRPFFMSIVSDSNHWMFIASNGGLTAGRKNPELSLFPYYTDDKIIESADITGSKSVFQIRADDQIYVWEPFSERFTGKYSISRNLYKNIYGNKIIFEEINHDFGLIFRVQWNSSKVYGFVKKSALVNTSDNDYKITLLDGLQNIMPYGVPSDLQRSTSNLVDAYKRSELEPESGTGIFALSAIIVDKAEPSEALKANIAWSLGLDHPKHLLSSLQLDHFRQGGAISEETDIKGEKGAYFVCEGILLPARNEKNWKLIANVNQNHAQIISLCQEIKNVADLELKIQEDIDSGTQKVIELVASADGLQFTADKLTDSRHFSNVLFNIMRGGIFDNGYLIKKEDFVSYLLKANREVVSRNQETIDELPYNFSRSALQNSVSGIDDADLIRLSSEYLPLKFSRRHGDPSRPWNYFTINIQHETDGSEILDYEGNWRDIFQNWEALALSYPEFVTGMIFKFLNASTFDGYNPYRITKDGFDWETIEPDNPWSYIGYWGDHQIIYLQKFFEIAEKFRPGTLQSLLDKEWFVYAAVPYRIKPYDQILKNPKDTIEFDHKWDDAIRKNRESLGADGALLSDSNRNICHVNFTEKVLATVLAKMSNFIPEAGIWMNTQRPEWNDANNALVGNGVSMVTLYYLHRFLEFFRNILDKTGTESVKISEELTDFYHSLNNTLLEFSPLLTNGITDQDRKVMLDRLGWAASGYRQRIYNNGFKGTRQSISLEGLKKFTIVCLDFIEQSIRVNKRSDNLYHAYNLMHATETSVSCSHLSEMLEGQTAVLSSGYLTSEQALEVLDALKSSALFRDDQYSYILYPNKKLPGFLEKNNIPPLRARESALIKRLIADGNTEIVERDVLGGLHFNGNFKNAADVNAALNRLSEGVYRELAERERKLVLDIFEEVFNHKAFTGRSGTFYSYEGLGSIYWHMVSKLHLAVQECCLKAIETGADKKVIGRLLDHYYEIEAGIGVHKSPGLYGAFPTDPYSHTPRHRGAQQPGMTGQVKEDILVRFGELGVFVNEGRLSFKPRLLRKDEFLQQEGIFKYRKCNGGTGEIKLAPGQLAFTCCQTPVIYFLSANDAITVFYANGDKTETEGNVLSQEISSLIFRRTGEIEKVEVSINNK